MDGKTIDLVNQRIDDLKGETLRRFASGEKRFDTIDENFKSVGVKLDALIQWRWKIGGAAIVIGIVAAFCWELSKIGIEHVLK